MGCDQYRRHLVPSVTDGDINAGSILQAKAVRSFVSSERLAIETEFQRVLTQALTLSKNSEDNAECATVTKTEVSLFTGRLIAKKNGDGIVSCGRLGWGLGGSTVARRSGSCLLATDRAFIFLGSDHGATTRRQCLLLHLLGHLRNLLLHATESCNRKASTGEVSNTLGFVDDSTINLFKSVDPNFGIQIITVTRLEGNLGSVDAVASRADIEAGIGVVANDTTEQQEAIISIVEVINQVELPHLADWNGRRKLLALPVVHDRLQFHELTVSLEDTLGEHLAHAMDSHDTFHQRCGATGERGVVLSVDFPPFLNLLLLGGASDIRHPQSGFTSGHLTIHLCDSGHLFLLYYLLIV